MYGIGPDYRRALVGSRNQKGPGRPRATPLGRDHTATYFG